MNDGRVCAECGKSERPWRRMLTVPLGSIWAYVCNEQCWASLDARARVAREDRAAEVRLRGEERVGRVRGES